MEFVWGEDGIMLLLTVLVTVVVPDVPPIERQGPRPADLRVPRQKEALI